MWSTGVMEGGGRERGRREEGDGREDREEKKNMKLRVVNPKFIACRVFRKKF